MTRSRSAVPSKKTAKKEVKPTKSARSLEELETLGEFPHGREVMHVRLLEVNGEKRLDIREFVDSDNYTGYTKRGICVNEATWKIILKLAAKGF